MFSLLKKKSGLTLAVCLIQVLIVLISSAEASGPAPAEQALGKGVFLLATDLLNGSVFHHAVILVVQHDGSGTAGVILNKPSEQPVSSIFPNIRKTGKSGVFFMGGPVMHKYVFSLVKTRRRLKNTTHVFEDVFFEGMIRPGSSTVQKLQDGERLKLFAGYSGWAPGQLEREISEGAWIVKSAVQSDVFLERPGTLWEDLMRGDSFLWAESESFSGYWTNMKL